MPRQDFLIYGKEYRLWRDGKYLGIATYTDDENVGEAFLKSIINDTGELCNAVYIADEWEFA